MIIFSFMIIQISCRFDLNTHIIPGGVIAFSLSLPKYRIRRAGSCLWCRASRRGSIHSNFSIAAGMIYSIRNLDSILPDPVLYVLGPRRLKHFLTDRTRGISKLSIIRCPNP